jgi:hypothetical protein
VIATDDRPVAGAVNGDALGRVLPAHAEDLFVDLGLAPRALVQGAPAAVLEALDEESWMSAMAWVTHHATCALWPTWGKPGTPGTVSPAVSKRDRATCACAYIAGISSSRCGSPIRIGSPVSVRSPEPTQLLLPPPVASGFTSAISDWIEGARSASAATQRVPSVPGGRGGRRAAPRGRSIPPPGQRRGAG